MRMSDFDNGGDDLLKIGDVFDAEQQQQRVRDKHDSAYIVPVIHYAKTFYKQSTLELFGEEHNTDFKFGTYPSQVSAHLFLKRLIDKYKSQGLRTCYLFEHVHFNKNPRRDLNEINNKKSLGKRVATPNNELEAGEGVILYQMDTNIEYICKYTDCFAVDDRTDFYKKMAKYLFGGAFRGLLMSPPDLMKGKVKNNIILLNVYRYLLDNNCLTEDIYKEYQETVVSTLQTFFLIAACLYNVDETFDDESVRLDMTPVAKKAKTKIKPFIGGERIKPCCEHFKRFIIKKVEWNIYNLFNIKMKYNRKTQKLVWLSNDVLFETDLFKLRNDPFQPGQILLDVTSKIPNDTTTNADYLYKCVLELNKSLLKSYDLYIVANSRVEYNTCSFLANNHEKYDVVIFYGGAAHTKFLSEILNSDRVQSFDSTTGFHRGLLTLDYDEFLTI